MNATCLTARRESLVPDEEATRLCRRDLGLTVHTDIIKVEDKPQDYQSINLHSRSTHRYGASLRRLGIDDQSGLSRSSTGGVLFSPDLG